MSKPGFILICCAVIAAFAVGFNVFSIKDRQGTAASGTLNVYVAAGLASAMQDLAADYPTQTGVSIQLNMASSAVLARQIAAGADWDVFISANQQWMDYVLEKRSNAGNEVVDIVKDRLALITPAAAPMSDVAVGTPDFAKKYTGHLAMGDPDSVPVGIYAKQALENFGWWEDLRDNVIVAVDVRAAQTYVETGQCSAGIVYLSGVKGSSKVDIVYIFDESLHEPICFVALANPDSADGKKFLEYLKTPFASDIFTRHGFQPLNDTVTIGK